MSVVEMAQNDTEWHTIERYYVRLNERVRQLISDKLTG